jgi:hypothetical protein
MVLPLTRYSPMEIPLAIYLPPALHSHHFHCN